MSDFPLLLAGPILRRVEPDIVSVWVATPESCKVKLQVYTGLMRASQLTGATTVAEAEVQTIRFGAELHLAVVLARPKPALMPEQNYSYNVTLSGASGTRDLAALHFLEDCRIGDDGDVVKDDRKPGKVNLAMGYQPDFLPSFALPPLKLTDLRVIHGSCRRANKDNPDGLAWVDDFIAGARTDPKRRPHQLLLTGDQIYADDVSRPMLEMLSLVSKFLIGGKRDASDDLIPIEELPVAGKKWPADVVHFPVGYRMTLTLNEAKLTSHDGHSHLLSFGEYCAMYLFSWSNACWPHELPPVEAFLPPMPWEGLIPSELKRPHILAPEEDFVKPGDAEAVKRTRKSIAADHKALNELRRILPRVRRALANVPTYMMFDDHEVTDDWNLNPIWRDRVYTSPLGRTILRNGLLAYALFQGWGNDPAKFERAIPDPEGETGLLFGLDQKFEPDLDKLKITDDLRVHFASHQFTLSEKATLTKKGSNWHIEDPESKSEFIVVKGTDKLKVFGNLPQAVLLDSAAKLFPPTGIDESVADKIDTLLGLDGKDPPVRWHYSYKGPKHLLLAIDNRTRRSFVSRLGPPGNVSAAAMKEQVPDGPLPAGIEVAVVVAPLPVLGPPVLDDLLAPLIYRIFDLTAYSDLAKHPGTKDMPGTNPDAIEAWAFDPKTFETLLARLESYKRVVLLSGDVHYASSQVMSYWRDLLASASAEFIADLDQGKLPEGVRKSLLEKGTKLSENATLSVQTPGSRWLITDKDGKSVIRKENGKLVIHRTENAPARFAQFTSSGMRNVMPWYIRQVDRSLAFGQRLIRANIGTERLGWDKNTPDPMQIPEGAEVVPALRRRLGTSPVLVPTEGWPENAAVNPAHPPDWSWRVDVLRDQRPDSERPKPAQPELLDPANPAADIAPNVDGYRRVVVRQARQLDRLNNSRQIQFERTNLGLVRFEERSGVLHAIHEIYSVHEDASNPDQPELYTLHVTALDTPAEVKPQAKFTPGGGA